VPFGFLKRRRSSAGHSGPDATARAGAGRRGISFHGLTEDWRLIGRMEIEGRLSDVLNRRASIPITDVAWAPIDGSAEPTPAPGLTRIDPFDRIVVFAGEGSLPPLSEAERAAHRHHKVSYDVALDVPPFRVVGTVYLFPGSEPERLLDRSSELFLPVTDAVLLLDDRPMGDLSADVVLVNRSYLRGVQQVDQQTVEATRALADRAANG
jgi:hypothetical protein